MAQQSIIEMKIRERFGLNVIALHHSGKTETEIDPQCLLSQGDTIVVIGKREKVSQFMEYYS